MNGWAAEMARLAAEFTRDFESAYGFEPGDNHVTLADDRARRAAVQAGGLLPAPLVDFYGVVGEVSLPDVHSGFFVASVESLVQGAGDVHPTKVVGAIEDDIVVFGTNGGGDLIAMATDGRVYMMGGGSLLGRVYDVDEDGIRAAFCDLAEFLAFLKAHLRDARADLR
ncbi:hypothetical protein OG948_36370 (plasmid) [Embleya sp. NBC_00888]|uniref:hypothetical protein n=1 Tax=Embleya sp. NBC_00888 TaxID=2975960 RepID=UPI002F906C75|nr:hypothetical protein OG948_36370 [Embleya sp. NBC_00888]